MSPYSAIGPRRHKLTLSTPGDPESDGMGGTTPGAPILIGPIDGRIEAATARSAEQILPSVVIANASHLVTIPYLPGVTLTSSLIFHDPDAGDRTFAISYVADPEERHIQLILACTEAK